MQILLPKSTISACLQVLYEVKDATYKAQQDPLQQLIAVLEEASISPEADADELLDEGSQTYLQSYKDQYTRKSYFQKIYGEPLGSSPTIAWSLRGYAHSNPMLEAELDKVADWDGFDVFRVAKLSRGHPLKAVVTAVLQHFSLVDKLHLPAGKLQSFLREVESAYDRRNPYHNSMHAADVVQNMASILACDALGPALTDLELLSLVLACCIHDVGHPGLTNDFLVASSAEAALLYNDCSVNENVHLELGFRILRRPENNFLEGWSDEEYRFVRRSVVDMVLATDMANHAAMTKDFTSVGRALGSDIRLWPAEKRSQALRMLVHCADIGNPAKPLALSIMWSERITSEFFAQGRQERAKGMPVSPLCDAEHVDIAKSQMTFLDYVVRPCFEALRVLAPNTAATALQNIEVAKRHWQQAPSRQDPPVFSMDDVCME